MTRGGTGVTVLLFPAGSVGSGEVRGGAPATRETDLLDPSRTVARVDAIVLAGGSAFGLAAADGVMRYLAERGQGFATAGGPVPIVPAACIFDLARVRTARRPAPTTGTRPRSLRRATSRVATGRVGAGAGATWGSGAGARARSRVGSASRRRRSTACRVGAVAVVNAIGDVIAADGTILAGSTAPADGPGFPTPEPFEEGRANTTLVAVVTDAALDKAACFLVAQSAHDGFARALRPAHTRFDGDIAFAVATGGAAIGTGAEPRSGAARGGGRRRRRPFAAR